MVTDDECLVEPFGEEFDHLWQEFGSSTVLAFPPGVG